MTQFTIPAHHLRSALLTALTFTEDDTSDALPALSAVHLVADAEEVLVVATDRYIACQERIKAEGDPFAVSVPPAVVRRVIAVIPDPEDSRDYKDAAMDMASFVDEGNGKVALRLVGSITSTLTFESATSDASDRVVSRVREHIEGVAAGADLAGTHFNAKFLGNVLLAMEVRGTGPVQIVAGGRDRPLLLTQDDGFRAMVMPMRWDA